MKSKIETTTPQTQEIDWGKPMLVRNNHTGDVILTSGKHSDLSFAGTVVVSESFNFGCYDAIWAKSLFTPLPLPQTITFYE